MVVAAVPSGVRRATRKSAVAPANRVPRRFFITMAGVLNFHTREAVRVKVKKFEGTRVPEQRRFSLDPQITTFEVLQDLLARAFDIHGEFTVSYLARDDEGGDAYLGLLSDWDLDAAFLSSSEPCLKLKVELKPFEDGLEEWDVVTPADLSRAEPQVKSSFTGAIINQMEKTLSRFQKALSLAGLPESSGSWTTGGSLGTASTTSSSCDVPPMKAAMDDREFRSYLDGDGRLLRPRELRRSVYQGGVEPSLRKVVWKHILNVYPEGLTGYERIRYVRAKSEQYYELRGAWQEMLSTDSLTDEMHYVTNMVRKDVLRTDRTHCFYAGADDNSNVVSLFNVLTTYALNHPTVSYCQGMSDLASPILVTMRDEAHAYVCFCALMKRLGPNFNLDGVAMTLKFQHLSELVQYFDPTFYAYLRQCGADDLLFCYRWLLLELKREFAFEDALRMLEVLWSSLSPCPPEGELALFERPFTRETAGPESPRPHPPRQNPYTKVRAIRKQNSAGSIQGAGATVASSSNSSTVSADDDLTGSGDDSDSQGYDAISTAVTRERTMDLDSLNRRIPGPLFSYGATDTAPSSDREPSSARDRDSAAWIQGDDEKQRDDDGDCPAVSTAVSETVCGGQGDAETRRIRSTKDRRSNSVESDSEEGASRRTSNNTSEGYVSEETTSSKEESTEVLDSGVLNHSSCEEALEHLGLGNKKARRPRLPKPQELGGGNPFMMFLCLTLLLQHRDKIMRNCMDYNELAMHFDKMVRRHKLNSVLHQTKTLYSDYLRMGWDSDHLQV